MPGELVQQEIKTDLVSWEKCMRTHSHTHTHETCIQVLPICTPVSEKRQRDAAGKEIVFVAVGPRPP